MSEKRNINPVEIKIREFKLVKGHIESPFEFQAGNIASFSYKVDLKTGVNFEERLVRADLVTEVSTVSKEKTEEAIASYHFVFIYHFEPIADHAKLDESGSVDWNPYLANAIASITYSTSRGILLSRFQGTIMEDFMLPVVDPNALLDNKPLSQSTV